MYTFDIFNEKLQNARDAQTHHPAAVEEFFDYALKSIFAFHERNTFRGEQILAKSQIIDQIQRELDESLDNVNNLANEMANVTSEANHRIAILRFQSIVYRVLKKGMQQREDALAEQNAREKNELQQEVVELTVENAKLAADFAKELAKQNKLLGEEMNTLRTVFQREEGKMNAARQRDQIQLTELKQKLEHALAQEEQVSQQNNILLSQMSAMENTHSILNPIYWSKASWYSFGIGLVVGEQAIEQFTDHKPVRRFIARGTKKLFGKSNSQTTERSAESLKPAMTGIEEYAAYVEAVPSPVVPVIQVHG